jgi:hypothetical protein
MLNESNPREWRLVFDCLLNVIVTEGILVEARIKVVSAIGELISALTSWKSAKYALGEEIVFVHHYCHQVL